MGSYSNIKKGSNSSRNSQKWLALGTERHSITASVRQLRIVQAGFKRSYFRKPKGEANQKCEATQKREATWKWVFNSPTNLFQPASEAKSEVELNHKATFTFTYHQSKQFKVF